MLAQYCADSLSALAVPGAKVEERPQCSATLALPGEFGFHYLYLGFNSDAKIAATFLADMAPGRPVCIWGPVDMWAMKGKSPSELADELKPAVSRVIAALPAEGR
jgi:hypothetical protein